MNIALLGYGKMGQTIEKLAIERGHTVGAIIDPLKAGGLTREKMQGIDVAIEFTRPEAAVENITNCIQWGVPIVSGTTGWLDKMPAIEALLSDYPNSAFFYASNYSLGVNIFFEVNRRLAKMMNTLSDYEVTMEEIHHTQKLDAPSGTGITLAEGIIENLDRKTEWVNHDTANSNQVALISKRIDAVPGTHTIKYASLVDDIEITHTAHSRHGFALGAIVAAEWIIGKKGYLTMQQMMEF